MAPKLNFQLLRSPRFIEYNPTPNKTTLICGVGRSGTTWVGNVVGAMTKSRVIFEPFIFDNNGQLLFARGRNGHFSTRVEMPIYFRNITENENIRSDIENILFGPINGGWINQDLNPGIYYRRLIKEIRANLILSSILQSWPDLRAIFVLRSPHAVVDSMLRKIQSDWRFAWDLNSLLDNENLIADHLAPYLSEIKKPRKLAGQLALRWCVETHVAMKTLRQQPNALFVRYENLRQISEWERIGRFLEDRGWRTTPHTEMLSRPSRTASDNLTKPPSKRYSALDIDDIKVIDELASVFSLDGLIYNFSTE